MHLRVELVPNPMAKVVDGSRREREPRIGHPAGNDGRTRHDQGRTVQTHHTRSGKRPLA